MDRRAQRDKDTHRQMTGNDRFFITTTGSGKKQMQVCSWKDGHSLSTVVKTRFAKNHQ